MKTRKILLLTSIALLSLTCVLTPPDAPQISLNNPAMVLAPANTTPTSTPFMPLPPTPTYLPTDFPTSIPSNTPITGSTTPSDLGFIQKTWEDYPGPTIWPDIDIPAPVGLLPQPEGQVNIVLLGSDQRLGQGGFRTDTILLATLDPKAGTANITSFPRDLYVYIPGWTVQRINTAFPHGGLPTLQLTFEYNFGVNPDYYVLINFWSFSQVIDNLGGIDVQVAKSLTDHRDKYGSYTVRAGTVRMDGDTALWYVRSRYSTNDFDRTRRQQEVVKAIFVKLLNLNVVTRAPQLYDIYKKNVTSDITMDVITPLLPLAATLSDTSLIHHYLIGPQQVTPWTNTNGAQVLLPIRSAVLEVMRQALNSP